MLAGTFFTAISQVLLKQSANKKYSNPSAGISELAGDRGVRDLFRCIASEHLVLYKSRYAVWTGDRYGCVCICSDLFKSDPERKDHKRKTCGNPADHSRNFDLYDVR